MVAEVIPEKRTGKDLEAFSYLVPEALESQIKVGSIVDVPWGKKTIRGMVLGVEGRRSKVEGNTKYQLKKVISIDPAFSIPEGYIKIIKWISKYYLCSLGEALALFLPPERVEGRRLKAEGKNGEGRIIKLAEDQEQVFRVLSEKLDMKTKKPALLLGVTGSGKTEIYLKLAEEVLGAGKQVIVLVPEIMLTPQTVERFRAVFGDKIALMHSGLAKSERYKSYRDFYSGEKPILIGARSALLVPGPNIGLIIVDEEHDGAYKQEKNPKYNAVVLASEIARENNALFVLGTATPTIESYYGALHGQYDLFELKNRYQQLILPPGTIVDLRNEIKLGNYSPISEKLVEEIARVLKNKRQVFLFLNRRGSATFVSCRECGEVVLCPSCSIPLVYHINSDSPPARGGVRGGGRCLNCHHCDFTGAVPTVCAACGSLKIKFFGAGTERIEKEIVALFPKARVRRIESKDLNSKKAYEDIYREIKGGQIDILIGTQIIAKGLDIPAVDLVGIVSADVGLHLPYYKANEKVFQILTQVSGRSGRRDNAGSTIIQTYWPESNAIRAALQHDYLAFYESEISERESFGYPPFKHLIRVVAEERRSEKAKKLIEAVAEDLRISEIDFIGPAPCFYQKLRNMHRHHLIIKLDRLPDKRVFEIHKKHQYLFWDVDPENLL